MPGPYIGDRMLILIACQTTQNLPAQEAEGDAGLPHDEIETCLDRLDGLPPEFRNDSRARQGQLIVVYKRLPKIALYQDGKLVPGACWDVALGDWPYEAKIRQDNMSTPEGWYTVSYKRTENPADQYPSTMFYKALHVSYPNAYDIVTASRRGVINPITADAMLRSIEHGELPAQNTAMGGAILIHGWSDDLPPTFGCIGMREADIDVLFDEVDDGTPILSLPWHRVIRQDATFDVAPLPADE